MSRLVNDDNPILVEQTRNGLVDNVYRGIVCVAKVRPDWGYDILYSLGNIDQVIYPRSAMKLVQVLPLIESGAADYYGFTDKELSIMCASHNAEPEHLDTVRGILSKIGLSESQLQCGSHTPGSLSCAFQYCQEAGKVLYPFDQPIFNNCSGKHAGFLALCKFLGETIDDY